MNKCKIIALWVCLLGGQQNISAQRAENASNWWVLPSSLVGLGILASTQSIKDAQTNFHQQNVGNFHTNLDDFLQYTPTFINVGLSVAHPNAKTRNAKITRFVLGTLMYASVTQGLKRAINVTRPDGTDHSFPSGHTATAFFGAHLLAKETSDTPWIGYLGYGIATSTGLLRMANNAHWASDVLVGAGIGMAAAELSYQLYPKLQRKWGNKHALQVNPIVGNNFYAFQVAFKLD